MTLAHSSVNSYDEPICDAFTMAPEMSCAMYGRMDLAWLKAELEKPGRSQSALARFMKLDHPAIVNRIVNGGRQLKAHEAEQIRAYLVATGGIPSRSSDIHNSRLIPVLGSVEAGAWREVSQGASEAETIPVVDHRVFEGETFALKVVGPSMNRLYPDGSFVIVRPWQGGPPPIGKRVVVHRIRPDGLYESTVKELLAGADGELELWPRSDDPRHQQSIPYRDGDGVTVQIVGQVVARLGFED